MTTATVVGSGPNGLAAAITLADAGVRVRVIEAADRPGGGLKSSELTLPGLLHDECAAFHPLVPWSPFVREARLAELGLRWSSAPVELAHPLGDGRGGALHRSVAGTATRLGEDGHRWERTFGHLVEDFDHVVEDILRPVLHLPAHPLGLARFGALAALPARAVTSALRSPSARALFAGVAAHALRPLGGPASASVGVALTTAAHAGGWPVIEGGSGALLDMLLRRAADLGVELETGRRVHDLDEVETDLVMLDTTPATAADIIGDALPAGTARAYRRFQHAPGVAKLDLAVERGIPWLQADARRAGTVHVGGDEREVAAALRDVTRGRLPARPFVLVGQQYLADPGRSRGDVHPVYAYCHVPSGYPGDPTDLILDRIEEAAPGTRERVLATRTRTTAEAQLSNANLVGGDVIGGASTTRQLVGRPRWSLDPYATGAPGVFLCSASTPPGAGAHGMCGYLAARSAVDALATGTGQRSRGTQGRSTRRNRGR